MKFGCPACPAFGFAIDVTTNVCTGVLCNCTNGYELSVPPLPPFVILPEIVEVPVIVNVACAPEPLPPCSGTSV